MTKTQKAKLTAAVAILALKKWPLFAAKRLLLQFSKNKALQDRARVVVFDLDETLSRSNASRDILRLKLGDEEGTRRYQAFRSMVKPVGKHTMEEVQLLGARQLVELGVTQKDLEAVVANWEKQGVIRSELAEVAAYLKRHGRKVLLVTKANQEIAEMIAKKCGFDAGMGTESIQENGRLMGVKQLVGERRKVVDGVPVVEKMDRVMAWARSQGLRVTRGNVTIVTDGLDDQRMLERAGFSVLFTPSHQGLSQKLAGKLKMSHTQVREEMPEKPKGKFSERSAKNKLKVLTRFPWSAKSKRMRG